MIKVASQALPGRSLRRNIVFQTPIIDLRQQKTISLNQQLANLKIPLKPTLRNRYQPDNNILIRRRLAAIDLLQKLFTQFGITLKKRIKQCEINGMVIVSHG